MVFHFLWHFSCCEISFFGTLQFWWHFRFDLDPPIWTHLFRYVSLTQVFEPIFWTRLFGPVYLDPYILTCSFRPVHFNLYISTHRFGTVYLNHTFPSFPTFPTFPFKFLSPYYFVFLLIFCLPIDFCLLKKLFLLDFCLLLFVLFLNFGLLLNFCLILDFYHIFDFCLPLDFCLILDICLLLDFCLLDFCILLDFCLLLNFFLLLDFYLLLDFCPALRQMTEQTTNNKEVPDYITLSRCLLDLTDLMKFGDWQLEEKKIVEQNFRVYSTRKIVLLIQKLLNQNLVLFLLFFKIWPKIAKKTMNIFPHTFWLKGSYNLHRIAKVTPYVCYPFFHLGRIHGLLEMLCLNLNKLQWKPNIGVWTYLCFQSLAFHPIYCGSPAVHSGFWDPSYIVIKSWYLCKVKSVAQKLSERTTCFMLDKETWGQEERKWVQFLQIFETLLCVFL